MRRFLKENGLSLALLSLFVLSLIGQSLAGWRTFNDDQRAHGGRPLEYVTYLTSGHFVEAVFENWESEFLQMAVFVLLTTWLVQKGSPESRRPGAKELVDTDPRDFAHDHRGPVAGQARWLDPAAL